MPVAKHDGVEIHYDTNGPDDGVALVLINGLGSQMIRWPPSFIDLLVDAGFRVIVHDNRDVGLSTHFTDVEERPPYTVSDMASDTISVLDALGIDKVHVVGQSMGGMIGQILAIEHPDRVSSLASVMSSMGDDYVPPDDPAALGIFTEPGEKERDKAIEQDVRHRRMISGPGFAFDEGAMRDLAERCYDRCYDPGGRRRQILAIGAGRGRKEALAKLTVPVVVIHGTHDPLIHVENGRRMAAAIPGADMVEVEGMGHDLPADARPRVVEAIVANTRRA